VSYIVDDIGVVVAALRETTIAPNAPGANAPYYMYGHPLYLANKLKEKTKDNILKYQKYPLIALRLDATEDRRGDITDYNLNLYIVNKTEINYTSEQRYTQVFKTILFPIYKRFLVSLRESNLFMWGKDQLEPPHTKIDRPFWGTPPSPAAQGTVKYIFDDPLDAIEILNLQISSRERCRVIL